MRRSQLRAILWLRFRLTRNQWARSKGMGPVLSVLLALLVGGIAFGSFVAGALGGYFGLADAAPSTLMLVWAGVSGMFLFWWAIGLLADLQRSELIDIPRLLHLPLRLGQLYAVNYVASLVGLTVPTFALGALGLAIGSAVTRGPAMLLPLPAFAALVFAVTAWTYCFQGWIATQVTNPRRRRMLVMVCTLVIVAIGQAPNVLINVFGVGNRHHGHDAAARLDSIHDEERFMATAERAAELVPVLWPGAAAERGAQGKPLVPVASALALVAIGALGLRRGYSGMLRYYQGAATSGASPARSSTVAAPDAMPKGRSLVERSLPGVHAQTSAVAVATLRSLLRAPEVTILVGVQVVVALSLGAMFLIRGSGHVPRQFAPLLVLGAVGFCFFLLTQFLINQFGLDRDGLRTLMLSPVPRGRLVLGKSLATATVAGVPSAILLVAALVALPIGALAALAAVFQWLTVLLSALLVGALFSILTPYRIRPGSMQAAKMPPLAVLMLVLAQLTFPVVLLPAALGPGALLLFDALDWPYGGLADLALSTVSALVLLGLFQQSMPLLGRLLARREPEILARVSVNEE
jgi:ABC-2 type transport system permease protein